MVERPRAASRGAIAAVELPTEAASVRGAGLEPRASMERVSVVSTLEALPQLAEPLSVEPRLEAQRPEERQEVEQVSVPSSRRLRESGARVSPLAADPASTVRASRPPEARPGVSVFRE